MAKVYLTSGATSYVVANTSDSVFGSTGTETISIASGVTAVTVDSNTETVAFGTALSNYKFKQTGNVLSIYDTDGTTLRATVAIDDNGSTVVFDGVSCNVAITSGVMSVDGIDLTSSATSVVTVYANDAAVHTAAADLSAKADNSILITNGAITTSQTEVLANITKFKADQITAITLANEAAIHAAATAVADDAVAADSITVTNGTITATSQTEVLANITKFKANQVTAITLADETAIHAAATQIADDAVKADSITVTTGTITATSQTEVLANITKFKANQVTAITLSESELNTANNDDTFATNSVTLDANAGGNDAVITLVGDDDVLFTISNLANSDTIVFSGLTGTTTFAAAVDSDNNDHIIGTINGGSNTGTIDAAGEWTYVDSTATLSYWDGATIQDIILTGVTSVTGDASATLSIFIS